MTEQRISQRPTIPADFFSSTVRQTVEPPSIDLDVSIPEVDYESIYDDVEDSQIIDLTNPIIPVDSTWDGFSKEMIDFLDKVLEGEQIVRDNEREQSNENLSQLLCDLLPKD